MLALPGAYFNQVYIDMIGSLPLSHGFAYLLTCIDRFTRCPEAIPVTEFLVLVSPQP